MKRELNVDNRSSIRILRVYVQIQDQSIIKVYFCLFNFVAYKCLLSKIFPKIINFQFSEGFFFLYVITNGYPPFIM